MAPDVRSHQSHVVQRTLSTLSIGGVNSNVKLHPSGFSGRRALPPPGLQHVCVIQAGHRQALHGSNQIFADFK